MKWWLNLIVGFFITNIVAGNPFSLKQDYDDTKSYMLNETLVKTTIKDYDERLKTIYTLLNRYPGHADWIGNLGGIYYKYDELIGSLLIEYCAFNKKFIENLFDDKFIKNHLNQSEIDLIELLKKYPDTVAARRTLNIVPIKITIDEILEEGEQNINGFSTKMRKSIVNELQCPFGYINQAIDGVRDFSSGLAKRLAAVKQHTERMREKLLKYKEAKVKAITDDKFKAEATQLFNIINAMSKASTAPGLVEKLKTHLGDFSGYFDDVAHSINSFEKWLRHMIVFEPIYIFSDANELRIKLTKTIDTFLTFKEDIEKTGKRIEWLSRFIDLLVLFEYVLIESNPRMLNLSQKSIDRVKLLLKKDVIYDYKQIRDEFSSMFNEYVSYYTTTNRIIYSEHVRKIFEFDYVKRILETMGPKIKEMQDNEQLNIFMRNQLKQFQSITKKIIPKANILSADCIDVISISNRVRYIVYALEDIYEWEQNQEITPVYKRTKDSFSEQFAKAKKVVNRNWIKIKDEHADIVRRSIANGFQSQLDMPMKLEHLLRVATRTSYNETMEFKTHRVNTI